MSIINDALKKTQAKFKKTDEAPEKKQEKQDDKSTVNVYEKMYQAQKDQQAAKAQGENSTKRTSTIRDSAAPRKAKKWLKTFTTIAFYLSIIGGGFFFISRYEPVQTFLRSRNKNIPPSRALIANHIPKKRTYKATDLTLNGTSLIDGKRVALINDEIYEIGEVINGKKIISINLNRVELQDNGEIVILKAY